MLKHPRSMIRDTTHYPPFMVARGGKLRPRRLKSLAAEFLGMEIQTGEHSPAEDAIAPMRLYHLVRRDWERWLAHHTPPPAPVPFRGAHARKEGGGAIRAEVQAVVHDIFAPAGTKRARPEAEEKRAERRQRRESK
jgi:hypothetical protein